MQETQVQSLGWEDPLEKEMAIHSSILAWRIPWIEEPGRLQFMGVTKSWTLQCRTHGFNLWVGGLPLEKGMAHFSIPNRRIPWTEESGAYGLQPMGSQSTGHNWVTNTVKLQNNCKETKGIFLVLKISTLMWMSVHICEVQFSSVAQLCLTLCDPMNRSTPGLPVHHQLLEFTQTHVHRICDAIQPSHSLSSPSPPALNLSQHQGLFQ